MKDNEGIRRLVDEIEYLRARRAQMATAIPRLIVVHGYHRPETDCLHGETVEQINLSVRSNVIPLRLSPTGLVIADVLARKRPMPLSASHIERILASDPFCVRLGANAAPAPRPTIRLTRKSIKVYIQRLRQQLGKALKEAGISMQPEEALVSESTDLLNVAAYRLTIPCEFVHMGGTAGRW
jgi:hypothetical protein